jgi:hypothetical protein
MLHQTQHNHILRKTKMLNHIPTLNNLNTRKEGNPNQNVFLQDQKAHNFLIIFHCNLWKNKHILYAKSNIQKYDFTPIKAEIFMNEEVKSTYM